MNNLINISFDIKYKTYNDNQKIIKLKNDFINDLSQSIISSSRLNSQNQIISYELGIIFLINNKINLKNNDILNIEFNIRLENPKQILTSEDIQEIIWCIMPSTYDLDGKINFSKDGKFRILDYTFEVLETPTNIYYNIL
jgi:hypothetical protein